MLKRSSITTVFLAMYWGRPARRGQHLRTTVQDQGMGSTFTPGAILAMVQVQVPMVNRKPPLSAMAISTISLKPSFGIPQLPTIRFLIHFTWNQNRHGLAISRGLLSALMLEVIRRCFRPRNGTYFFPLNLRSLIACWLNQVLPARNFPILLLPPTIRRLSVHPRCPTAFH